MVIILLIIIDLCCRDAYLRLLENNDTGLYKEDASMRLYSRIVIISWNIPDFASNCYWSV